MKLLWSLDFGLWSFIENASRCRSIVAVFDRVDSPHGFLACLFFDDVSHQSRRARDHKDAVERCRIHSEIGIKTGVDGYRPGMTEEERVAVRRRARDHAIADRAASAGAVVDNEALMQLSVSKEECRKLWL